MYNAEIIGANSMISNVFDQISAIKNNENKKLISVWEKILKKIDGCGQNLYENSSLVDIKNNILLVEATHSGWIQMLQMNSKFILKGLSMYAPELEIQSLAFRLRGSNATLHEINYDEILKSEKEKQKKNFAEDDKILEEYEKKSEPKKEEYKLPEELLKKFENLKRMAEEDK